MSNNVQPAASLLMSGHLTLKVRFTKPPTGWQPVVNHYS
jgi:hypothetical protein